MSVKRSPAGVKRSPARATGDPAPAAAWHADGALHWGVGIEDTFIPQERPGHRRLDLYELTQHYWHWRGDLALAAESGADLIRWGIPWYLTEPEPGRFDFTWVDRVAAEMQRLGLRCVVDLMHYGTPTWMDNQFLNPAYPRAVARYAGAVASRYAGVLEDFTPLNEPTVNAQWCGMLGHWPPYLRGHAGFLALALPLVRGMQATVAAVRRANPAAQIMHVDAGFRWQGAQASAEGRVPGGGPGPSAEDLAFLDEWRFLLTDLAMGRVDAAHPLAGYLAAHGIGEEMLESLRAGAMVPDVMGVNYYPAFTTRRIGLLPGSAGASSDGAGPDGAAGAAPWERLGPGTPGFDEPVEAGVEGLVDLVRTYADRYDLPLAVTETSRIATDPAEKIAWIEDLSAAADRLRSQGVDLRAVFWFPFLDMFDWEYRFATDPVDAHHQPFGLVDLRRGPDNVLHRVPNPAYDRFRRLTGASAGPTST